MLSSRLSDGILLDDDEFSPARDPVTLVPRGRTASRG